MGAVTLVVALQAPAEAVWDRAVTIDGVNEEFSPLMRMTVPRGLEGATIADLTPGESVGRSWILLGGLIPVDWDAIGIAEVEPPRRFLERSSMASMSRWQHERTIDPVGVGEGSTVTDALAFELRRPLRWIPGSGRLAAAVVGALFRHRHRRLAAMHGAATAA